jgi:hypothetical protein
MGTSIQHQGLSVVVNIYLTRLYIDGLDMGFSPGSGFPMSFCECKGFYLIHSSLFMRRFLSGEK